MPQYIDKDKAINKFSDASPIGRSVRQSIDEIPTVDVVEVVRCKDCSHCAGEVFGGIYCRLHDGNLDKEAYCSYGERNE